MSPTALERMLLQGDELQTQRVIKAMLAMKKLDIAALEKAYVSE